MSQQRSSDTASPDQQDLSQPDTGKRVGDQSRKDDLEEREQFTWSLQQIDSGKQLTVILRLDGSCDILPDFPDVKMNENL